MKEVRGQRSEGRGRRTEVRGRGAFTLIEMLVVVAIIMILMGLLFPAFSYARQVAKKTKAKSDVKQLDMAWKGVLSDYRTWLLANVPSTTGFDMYKARVDYLAGNHANNTKGIAYMEFDGSSTNAVGAMVDPWYHISQNPNGIYQVALSSMAGMNSVAVPYGNGTVNRSVAAWSRGLDGKNVTVQEQRDDIKSWE